MEAKGLRELHLFSGAGGGILGGMLLGHTCVCAVEIEPYCRKVLLQRQRDGILPKFPIWDDVRTFNGKPWRGIVDVVCGGFPCQDISVAGKGAGISGARSGLWKQFKRILGEVRPRYAFVENNPALVIRGLGTILGDLAEMGFDARWGVFSCREVGGVHLRERIFIFASNKNQVRRNGRAVEGNRMGREIAARDEDGSSIAFTDAERMQRNGRCDHAKSNQSGQKPKSGNGIGSPDVANSRIQRIQGKFKTIRRFTAFPWGEDVRRIEDLQNRPDIPQPLVRRIGNDVACGVDRLKAIGNGQVPRVVKLAWETLSGATVVNGNEEHLVSPGSPKSASGLISYNKGSAA